MTKTQEQQPITSRPRSSIQHAHNRNDRPLGRPARVVGRYGADSKQAQAFVPRAKLADAVARSSQQQPPVTPTRPNAAVAALTDAALELLANKTGSAAGGSGGNFTAAGVSVGRSRAAGGCCSAAPPLSASLSIRTAALHCMQALNTLPPPLNLFFRQLYHPWGLKRKGTCLIDNLAGDDLVADTALQGTRELNRLISWG
jgi:hypothetical protein